MDQASVPFGQTHVIHPQEPHTHTIILLHGRGSPAEEFFEELFESHLSNGQTLQEALPSWKWVLPSSRELWSDTFQEYMASWFDAQSLSDPTARQDLQAQGIRDSVSHVSKIVEEEVRLLDGKAGNVVLGGISQGGAIALWTLLYRRKTNEQRLGAFVGASTWLPFAENIQSLFFPETQQTSEVLTFDSFVRDMIGPPQEELGKNFPMAFTETPVFIGHGADDAYVDVELGQQVTQVLSEIGFKVTWKEYTGAEEEGHWLKVPEEIEDIKEFLCRVFEPAT